MMADGPSLRILAPKRLNSDRWLNRSGNTLSVIKLTPRPRHINAINGP